jgi:hypothetical protein
VPLTNRHARRNKSKVDRKKERNPNVETAASPRPRSTGRGSKVAELAMVFAMMAF